MEYEVRCLESQRQSRLIPPALRAVRSLKHAAEFVTEHLRDALPVIGYSRDIWEKALLHLFPIVSGVSSGTFHHPQSGRQIDILRWCSRPNRLGKNHTPQDTKHKAQDSRHGERNATIGGLVSRGLNLSWSYFSRQVTSLSI